MNRLTSSRLLPASHLVWLALCAACLLLLSPSVSLANFQVEAAAPGLEETGIPSFTIYSGESLGLQSPPYDLVEYPDGRILIAGANELVLGDGVRWELLPKARTEPGFIAGQISVSSDGVIHVSRPEGFSSIQFNNAGRWFFTTPTPLPNHDVEKWPALILHTKSSRHEYWYGGLLAEWKPQSDVPPKIIMERGNLDHVFNIGDTLYASDANNGSITSITPDGRQKIIVSENTTNGTDSIHCSAPYDEHSVLVGTVMKGVRIFDGQTSRPLFTQGPLAGGSFISDLCLTRSGFYVAAVEATGLVFFRKDGHIIQILDRGVDHRFSQVRRLVCTSDGSLWALFSKGVARIDFPSRISHLDSFLSTGSDYVEPVRHLGRLWLLATGNAMRANYDESGRLSGFTRDNPPIDFVYTLASVDGRLLASSEKGLYEQDASGWHPLIPGIINARIATKAPDGRWLYAARNEVGWLSLSGPNVTAERFPMPEMGDVYNALADVKGMVWLELGVSKVARVNPFSPNAETRVFGKGDGIPGGWSELFQIDGSVRMNCSGRSYVFNETTQRFEDSPLFRVKFPELRNAIGGRIARDSAGRLWFPSTDYVRIVQDNAAGSGRVLETLPADLKPGTFVCSPDGVVWMMERQHFSRYDPSMPPTLGGRIKAVITRLEFPGTDRCLLAPFLKLPPFENTENSLIAHFAAVGAPFGERITFDMKVEGLDDQWLPLGVTGSASINRIKEGSYVLHIRPLSSQGFGEEAMISFSIRPPWYRTTIAYLGFGTAGFLLLGLAILGPVYLERRQKQILTHLVADRTRELTISEDRYRKLSIELEGHVSERTRDLARRVTEVERLNADLDLAAAKLTDANRELESFSYSVSHDLRSPLRNLTGFIEIMDRRMKEGSYAECPHYMEIITSEAKRMSVLIEDLLSFSRLARADLHEGTINLDKLADQVRQSFAAECANRHINWTLSPLPLVRGDEALIRQVLVNLLGNAVKFTGKRSLASIEVGRVPGQETDGFATCFVKDNGAGFNPKYTDRLFGVFQRLHSTREFEGTGIGLANVKRIIVRHGGKVWAESTQGEGACFYFTLPLVGPSTFNPQI